MKHNKRPQAAQERELDRLAMDNGNGGGRNTGPVGMAGGAQDAAETKKVLRQLVCPFPI